MVFVFGSSNKKSFFALVENRRLHGQVMGINTSEEEDNPRETAPLHRSELNPHSSICGRVMVTLLPRGVITPMCPTYQELSQEIMVLTPRTPFLPSIVGWDSATAEIGKEWRTNWRILIQWPGLGVEFFQVEFCLTGNGNHTKIPCSSPSSIVHTAWWLLSRRTTERTLPPRLTNCPWSMFPCHESS